MKIKLLTLEDGLANPGFRKFAAYVKRLHANTDVYFVVTGNYRSFKHLLFSQVDSNALHPADVEIIAAELADADIVGFSSMTQYAGATVELINAVRRHNPKAYVVWGGIHPIIEPADAILHADAICTGEGEFAFEHFLAAFTAGRSYLETPSFWFNTPEGVRKNRNLPLMTPAEMDGLPIPLYQDGEYIFRSRRGFEPIGAKDFVFYNGLSYQTLWSIGCPFKCTYCGNTTFIDYDKAYRKIRHSSPATMIAELKDAVRKHPHISSIFFHDDSFMALPTKVIAEFCELYDREIGLPFVVMGLIPNYVREDKVRMLIAAGMNRVRMGIQSGSDAILQFYERPTPIPRVREAIAILNKFRDHMLQPTFDIILDNPLETADDVRATLDLVYAMPRPYTLNIYALRVIPNTRMAQAMQSRGLSIDSIRKPYTRPRPVLSNILVPAMVAFSLPKTVYAALRARSFPSHMPQRHYPGIALLIRFCYLVRTACHHLRRLDLTVVSGNSAVLLWRLQVLRVWQKLVLPLYARKRRMLTASYPQYTAAVDEREADALPSRAPVPATLALQEAKPRRPINLPPAATALPGKTGSATTPAKLRSEDGSLVPRLPSTSG